MTIARPYTFGKSNKQAQQPALQTLARTEPLTQGALLAVAGLTEYPFGIRILLAVELLQCVQIGG
jgi:hypothetical protein